jgi:predicted MPP superfamily phosphohydrolase
MLALPKLSRRAFVRGGIACVCAAAGLDAIAIEPRWLAVSRREIAVPGLPRALAGYRIAQLSDLHLTSLGALHDAVCREVIAFEPQLVVISGDAVESEGALGALAELCGRLAGPGRDVVATLGNWEHWGRVPLASVAAAYARAGARLLRNESAVLPSGPRVLATDDFCSGHDDIATALASWAPSEVTLFVTHAPGLVDALPPAMPGFALGLAGHTHGGQVCAAGKSVWLPPGSGRFVEGLYTTRSGPLYVSRGIGTSVLPVRFTCRPELPLLRLSPA